MELSQLAIDIIGYISFGIIWLPLLASLVFFLGFAIFVCVEEEHLKKDYFKQLSEDDRKVVMNYLDNTNYFRYKRRLRRIKKNFLYNSKDEKD